MPQPARALAGSVGALLTCALLPSAAHGATWTCFSSGNASGTWGTGSNWSGGTAPNATDAVADFSTLDITADSTVTVGTPVTTGTMLFGDTTPSNNWIVSGSAITLATSGANAPLIQVNNQTVTFNAALAGTQGFVKSGAGTLVLTGSNSYSGGTTVGGGTLQFSGSFAMPGATAITLNSPGTLDLGGTSRTTTGLVTLNGGTLQNGVLTSNNAGEATNNQFSGTITLGSGGAFVTNQRLLMANGGTAAFTIAPGSTGTMTFGGDNGSNENYVAFGGGTATLSINGGAVNFTNSSYGTGNGYLNVGSNNAGSNGTITINGANLNVGTWLKLGGNYNSIAGISTTSALSISNGAVKIGGGSDTGYNGALFMNGGNGDTTANTGTSTLTVGSSGTLTVTQIQAGNGGTKTINLNGGTIVAAPGAASAFLLSATGLSVNIQSGGATINSGTSAITVGAPLSGTGGLTLTGAGTVLLTATNSSLTGPISVNGGALAGGTGANVFGGIAGAVTVAAGAGFGFNNIGVFNQNTYANNLFLSGTGVSPAFGALELGGNVTSTGTITLNASARITHNWNIATVNGPIVGTNTSLTLATFQPSQYGFYVNGNINLGAGALIVNGIGTADSPDVTLSGSNSYSGGTQVNSGVLSVSSTNALPGWNTGAFNIASGATLVVPNAFSDSNVATLLGSGTFAAGASFGFDTGSGNRVSSANIANTAGGALGLIKMGANALTLSGSNSYTGPTTVWSGTLKAGSAYAFSTGTLGGIAGTIDLNGYNAGVSSLALNGVTVAATGGGTLTLTGGTAINIGASYAATCVSANLAISGTGGAIVKSAANGTPVLSGALDLGGGNRIFSLQDTSGYVAELTVSGSIGDGSLTLSNTAAGYTSYGTLYLTGTNNYAGGTTISAGALSINNGSALGSGTVTIGTDGSLLFGGQGIVNVTGVNVANPLSINRPAGGVWALAIQNYAGSNTLSGAVALQSAATPVTVTSGTLTMSWAVSGTGGWNISGPGTMLFSNSNSYSGGTTVTSGVLQVGNANALGASTAALSLTGTLDLNGYSPAAGALTGSGTIGNNSGAGASILTLNGTASATFSGVIKDNLGTAGGSTGITVSNPWALTTGISGNGGVAATGATQTLSGSSTYSGPTVVNAGTLQIAGLNGFLAGTGTVTVTGNASLIAGDTATPANNNNIVNRINANASLILGGATGAGTLVAPFGATGTTSQTFASLTVNPGGNTVTTANTAAGTNNLIFTGAGGAGYVRATNGILNVTSTTGFNPQFTNAPTAAGGSSVSGAAGSGNEILIGAILNATDFVSATSGNLAASAYTPSAAGSLTAGANVNLTGGNTTLPGSTVLSINSLKFTDNAARTLNLGTNSQLTIASGGILTGSAVATAGSTITSGSLTSGVGDLWIYANGSGLNNARNSNTALTIASQIYGNISLTVAGGQQVTLSNTVNSYTGGTYLVGGGRLVIPGDGALGAAGGTVTAVSGFNSISPNAGFTFNSSRNFVIDAGAALMIGDQGQTNTIPGLISGAGELQIGYVSAAQRLFLTNTNSGFTGRYDLNGYLVATEGVGLSSNANLNFTGRSTGIIGLLETNGSFTRSLGSGAGQVQWQNDGQYGYGGFAAVSATAGTPLTVNLGGAGATLTIGSGYFVPAAYAGNGLRFQDANSNGPVTFVNSINLNGAVRGIDVGGPALTAASGTSGALATVSGVLSGNASAGLSKNYNGVLSLTATNTYGGPTTVSGGVLRANDGTGLPSAGNLTINGGVLETGVNLTRALGSGAGAVQVTGGVSGFSAYGAPALIAIGGTTSPTALTWGSATFAPTTLVLNEVTANNTLTFANAIDLSGSTVQTINVNAATAIMTGVLSGGTTSLTKGGAGTLVLAANETYATTSGSTTISTGTLQLGNGGATGSVVGNISISSGAVLAFNRSDAGLVMSGTISGSGSVVQAGSGLTVLAAGTNTYTGTTTISSGTLQFGNGTTGAVLGSGSVTVAGGATLALNLPASGTFGSPIAMNNYSAPNAVVSILSSGTVTLSNNITGTVYSTLNQTGTGVTILAGNDTFFGPTNITSGTLQIGWSGALNNSTVNIGVNNGLAFGVANPWVGGLSGTGSLVLSSTAGAAAALSVGVNTSISSSYSGAISGLGSLTKINSSPQTLSGNLSYTGSTTVNGGLLTLTGSNSYTGATTVSSGSLQFGANSPYAVPAASTLNVNGGVFDLNGNNFTTTAMGAGNAAGLITDNSAVSGTTVFTLSTSTPGVTVPINDGANGRVLAVNVTNSNAAGSLAANSTFSGGVTLLTGPGNGTRLSYSGTGAGSPGAIVSSPLGRGTLTIGLSTTDKAQLSIASGSSVVLNNILFNSALGTDVTAAVRVGGSNIVLAGTLIAGLADINLGDSNGPGSATLQGQLTGSNGLWIKNAYNSNLTVTLSNTTGAANNYLGNTTVDSRHTLILGAANQIPSGVGYGNLVLNGTMNLGGYSTTINNITGSTAAAVLEAGGGTPVFTVGATNLSGTYAGAIKNSSGTLSLIKAGAGTLTLTGSLTYGGSTTINGGTLALAPATGITNTLAGNIGGAGVLSIAGSGTTTLQGSNNYGGGTVLNGGVLSISSDANIGGSSGALTFNGGILQVTGVGMTNIDSHTVNWSTFSGGIDVNNAANVFTVNETLSGTGTFTKLGAGMLLLGGSNSNTGGVIVTAGTLQMTNASALGTGNLPVSVSGVLDLNGYSPTIGALSGTGVIGNNFGSGISTLTLNGTAATTFAGTLADNLGNAGGTLALVKSGPVTQTLSGTSTYTGATLVNGQICFGSMIGAGGSGAVQSSGALQVSGSLANTAGLSIANGGVFTDGNATAASNNGVVNRINPAATLTMGGTNGGGTFTMAAPAAGNTTSQTFAALAVGPGFNTISANATTGTANLIFSGAGGSVYTRSTGAMINFSGTSGLLMSFANAPSINTAGSGANAILVGAYLSGTDFVAVNSGTLTGATYTANSASALTPGANINITGTSTSGLAGLQSINSLRFVDSTARAVTLSSGTLQIAGGGIAVGASVPHGVGPGVGTLSGISGGALTSGTNEIFFSGQNNQYIRNGFGFQIDSQIVDNGAPVGLNITGGGALLLTNTANSFTGNIYLNGGSLGLASPTGAATTDAVLGGSNTIYATSGNNVVRADLGTTNAWSNKHNVVINAGAQFDLNTQNGPITFNAQLSGSGVFSLGVNTYNSGNGVIVPVSENGFTGTYVVGNFLRADDGVGLSSNANLALATTGNGVLETKANFTRFVGFGPGQVQFTEVQSNYWGGGFSAVGTAGANPVTVSLGGLGTPTALTCWTGGTPGFFTYGTGGILYLQDGNANNTLTWANPIAIPSSTLTIQQSAATSGSSTAATLTGALTGAGAITKTGGGLLILSATNTYGGTTTISNGTLRANDGIGLPSTGNLTINGAIFETGANITRPLGTGTGAVQITGGVSGFSANSAPALIAIGGTASPTALTWGSATFAPTTLVLNEVTANNTLTFANAIDLSGSTVQTINVNAATAVMTGALTGGTTSLTKGGAGTLVLAANETYGGGTTTISSGTVQLGNGGSTGSVIGNIVDSGVLVFNRSDSALVESGTVSSSGAVVNAGGGTVTLAAVNTYSGATTLTGGTLSISSLAVGGANSGIGKSSNAATNLVFNGGSLLYTGATGTTDRLFSVGTGGGTIDSSGSGPLTFNNTGALGFNSQTGARTLTLTGTNNGTLASVIADNGGSTSLVKNGPGTWVLSAANTHSGDTTINSGTLQLGSTLYNSTVNLNGGSLSFGSQTSTALGGLKGSGSLALTNTAGAAVTLTVGNDNQSTVYSGVLSGSGSVYKTGSGTWTLSGNNTYTGATTIHSGSAVFTGSNTLGNTGFSIGDSASVPATMTLSGTSVLTLPGNTGSYGLYVTGSASSLAVLNIRDSAQLNLPNASGTGTTFGTALNVGVGGAGASGAVFQSGGAVNIDQTLGVGSGPGAGYYSLSGGSLTVTGSVGNPSARFRVGNPSAGSYGLLAIAGGTANVSGVVGYGIGIVDSSGTGAAAGYGSIYVTGGSLISAANYLNIGNRFGQGDLTISGSGIVNVSANSTIIGASDSNAVGILNLNGGMLQTGEVNKGSGAGTSYVNFSGGTLRANNADANFLTGLTRATINGAYVSGGIGYAGSATIDTNGNAVTIGQSLQAPIGNGVAVGAGFTPITGLIGVPFVLVTGGGGTGATAQAMFDPGSGTVTGITVTNPGVGYSGTPTFQLVGGGLTGTTSVTGTTVANTGGGLTKTGAGTLILTGSNTYSGGTTVNNGTLQLGNANALGATTGALAVNAGTLDLHGYNVSVGALSGSAGALINSAVSGTRTLTSTASSGTSTYAGSIANGTGVIALNKSGAGTLALSGSNSYSGGTTVNGGTLNVNADQALGASSASVTINDGATLQTSGSFAFNASRGVILSGSATIDTQANTNTISGPVSASTATLVKQGSGSLIVSGSLTMAGLNANNGAVQLAQSGSIGAINVGVAATVALAAHSGSNYNVLNTSSLTIAGFSSVIASPGNAAPATTLNATGLGNSANATLATAGQSQNAGAAAQPTIEPVSPEAVPEPGTLGLLLAGAMGLLGRRNGKKTFQGK